MSKFKVGDRVVLTKEDTTSSATVGMRGVVDSLLNFDCLSAEVFFDNGKRQFIDIECLKRLRKKPVQLKVGDRVVLKFKDGCSYVPVGTKGEIGSVFADGLVCVRIKECLSQTINPKNLRRLRKKPMEFKTGDRFIDKKDGEKGTVKSFHANTLSISVKFDNESYAFIAPSYIRKYIRKLVKKKKPVAQVKGDAMTTLRIEKLEHQVESLWAAIRGTRAA